MSRMPGVSGRVIAGVIVIQHSLTSEQRDAHEDAVLEVTHKVHAEHRLNLEYREVILKGEREDVLAKRKARDGRTLRKYRRATQRDWQRTLSARRRYEQACRKMGVSFSEDDGVPESWIRKPKLRSQR